MRWFGRALSGVARRARPRAGHLPPWERNLLDDLAVQRPWNIAVKAARLRARCRLQQRSLADGVTVVIVNWNTRQIVADVLRAVQTFSPAGTRVLVVDNGSTDGSRQMLREWPGIDTMLLRSNAGHGVALDLAVCSVRTRVALTLDSDAIPLCEGWMSAAVDPVMSGEARLAGQRSKRNFVHPVYLAVDTEAFVRRGLSLQLHRPAAVTVESAIWGENAWDTAELLTPRLLADEVRFVEATPKLVEELPGQMVAGVVYHHGGVSREADGAISECAMKEWTAACLAVREALKASG